MLARPHDGTTPLPSPPPSPSPTPLLQYTTTCPCYTPSSRMGPAVPLPTATVVARFCSLGRMWLCSVHHLVACGYSRSTTWSHVAMLSPPLGRTATLSPPLGRTATLSPPLGCTTTSVHQQRRCRLGLCGLRRLARDRDLVIRDNPCWPLGRKRAEATSLILVIIVPAGTREDPLTFVALTLGVRHLRDAHEWMTLGIRPMRNSNDDAPQGTPQCRIV
jgi:hypothetical protein